jgi:two-component system chemotaxis response regulator CheB
MLVRQVSPGDWRIAINDQPAENGCRPSVDVLFRSAAANFGAAATAIVLTGMGSDGTRGLAPLHRAGAYVIAQDRATSVVWGMPGSAVQAGLVHEELPLNEIPGAVRKRLFATPSLNAIPLDTAAENELPASI